MCIRDSLYFSTIGSIALLPVGYLTIIYFTAETELISWSFFDESNIDIVSGVVTELLDVFPSNCDRRYTKWLETLEVMRRPDAA